MNSAMLEQPSNASNNQNEMFHFGLRSGTRMGVAEHILRAESQIDLTNWSFSFIQGSNAAVELVRELSTSLWQIILFEKLYVYEMFNSFMKTV